jgi:hypothetical protein
MNQNWNQTRNAYIDVKRHELQADPQIAPLHKAEAEARSVLEQAKRRHMELTMVHQKAMQDLLKALEPHIPEEFQIKE